MEITLSNINLSQNANRAFWVIWSIELWERFGYYGVQAILALYFVSKLDYTESQSFYIFGSFSAFVYGFIWIGGWVGDKYLGAKRTLILGAIVLTISYAGLALSNSHTIFYALAGIIVGNALFKANPSSLISKLYEKGDVALDGAMTLYYMAINVGSMLSMAITPIISQNYGWASAYWLCALGLLLGLANYYIYHQSLSLLKTEPEEHSINLSRLFIVITVSLGAIEVIAQLLNNTRICNLIVYVVVSGAFLYFLKITFSLNKVERSRMLIAFILIVQGILFFVLYNQMPTSLTFFAVHNIDNHFFSWVIPPAEYQVLNPLAIVLMSPLLVKTYKFLPMSHVTKFCIGMTLCALAYLILAIPQYTATNGLASPVWMVITYFLQSVGELFISALGLAMVAELCPSNISGFVMGVWYLTSMLAGPIGAWVGSLTIPSVGAEHFSKVESMQLYAHVFLKTGVVTGVAAFLMWILCPYLNRYLKESITTLERKATY